MTAAKSLPILMSAPMILGLKARRKTQTRRTRGLEEASEVDVWEREAGATWLGGEYVEASIANVARVRCPYGAAGGELYVREGVRRVPNPKDAGQTESGEYIADGAPTSLTSWPWKNKALPAIHMPRHLSRFLLDLQSVRVERLQAITEADAQAEGLEPRGSLWGWPGAPEPHESARAAYQAGWEWLNGEGSWARNPWVWVLSFDSREV